MTQRAPLPSPPPEIDAWHDGLDALLSLAQSVDLRSGAEGVAQHCLTQAGRSFPTCALGLCVVDPLTGTSFTRVHLPAGMHAPQQDPTRLFPCFSREIVLPLGKELPGSTFHVAADDVPLDAGSFAHELGERLARLSATLIRQAQLLDRSPNSMQVIQKLRNRLVQAEKLASLGQVVTGVVHELATPLTAIVSYSAYLQDKARKNGGDAADIERLDRIADSAQRILEFTRDLVAYARPSMRVPATVDLHSVIEKALVFCDHELSSHRVKAELTLSAAHPFVLGTQSALTQVFVNLAINAAQAMQGNGGLLTIATEHDQQTSHVIVRVSDEGDGIASDVLPRIFDPFFTTKPEREGTGLGLAIVREILQTHRGKIEVHSTPGEGTTFLLTFPSASAASAP